MKDENRGLRVWLARKAVEEVRGIQHGEFCRILRLRASTISQWETGLNCPDTPWLKAMSELFGIGADWVLCGRLGSLAWDLQNEVVKQIAERRLVHLLGP